MNTILRLLKQAGNILIMKNNRPMVGVGVCIVKDGKVLVGQRLNAHGHGTWSFPGGHLEYGESPEACAKREAYEEGGVKIKNIRFATITNDIHKKEGIHYITIVIRCDGASGIPKVLEPDKMVKWDWFEWDNLPAPLFLAFENLINSGYKPI